MTIPPAPPAPPSVPAPAAPAKAKMRGRTKALIIGGAAVVVLGGGGAAAGVFLFNSPTPTADQGIPADVDAVTVINLNPSNADKLALRDIVGKLPDLDTSSAGDDYKKALWELIPDSAGSPDYDSDIAPWLGDSFALGFAAGDDSSRSPDVIAAVQITNEAAAQAFADEYLPGLETVFRDDLMVFFDADSPWTEESVDSGSIADNEVYKNDVARLDGNSLAVAWVSPSLADTALQDAQLPSYPSAPTADLSAYEGAHGAAGLQVASGMLTLQAVGQFPNAPESADTPADVSDFAGELDGDALGAVSMGASDALYEQFWDLLSTESSTQSMLQSLDITSVDDLRALFGARWGITIDADDDMRPVLGAKFQTEDPERQKELLDGIDDILAQQMGSSDAMSVTQEGDTAFVAYGQDPSAVANPAQRLGDLDSYKAIVDGPTQFLFFANIDNITALPGFQSSSTPDELLQWLEPLSAVGFTANQGADHLTEVKLRITFD